MELNVPKLPSPSSAEVMEVVGGGEEEGLGGGFFKWDKGYAERNGTLFCVTRTKTVMGDRRKKGERFQSQTDSGVPDALHSAHAWSCLPSPHVMIHIEVANPSLSLSKNSNAACVILTPCAWYRKARKTRYADMSIEVIGSFYKK